VSRASEPIELAEGTRLLDRYSILDRVGSGGMASIYRATDERLDRIVCVKLLRLVIESSDGAKRGFYRASYAHFLKEALALSKLQHPNTLRIYDFGYLADGRPFQISEFLDGGNLETQIRAHGPFAFDETLGILERITGAVSEAHAHGIIHRDIKPSNILFSRVGDVLMPKLADFGIAQSKLRKRDGEEDDAPESDDPSDVISTVALFSPRWAAPEQIAGGSEGPSTDVYALGLVTAYMLAGRAPFADSDVRAHFGDRIRGDTYVAQRLDELAIEPALNGVLLRALTANPDTRIASPDVFFEALRAAHGTTPPLPPTPIRPKLESITLLTEPNEMPLSDDAPRFTTPPERVLALGAPRARVVRVVQINEKLDVAMEGDSALRFRVTFLPSRASPAENPAGFALHVKGLNCFVAKPEGRPTPAIVATNDGNAAFVSAEKHAMGSLAWSFGVPSRSVGADAGRVFAVNGAELVIPYSEASQAVSLDLGSSREIIVMCKR